MDDPLHDAPIRAIETTPDGKITAVNERVGPLTETDRDVLVGSDIQTGFPSTAAGTLTEAFADTPPSETDFTEYYPQIDRWLAVRVVPGDPVRLYVQDRTAEREADRRADRLNRRLDRVQQIDSLIVTVLQRIISNHHGAARLRKSLTPLISLARRCCTTSAGSSESSSMRFCQRPLKRGRGRISSTICRSPRKHRAD